MELEQNRFKLDPKSTSHGEHKLLERLQSGYQKLKGEIHKVVVGQDEVIDAVLSAVLAGGHCIVQGVPGLAKTLLVHAISDAMDLTFNRIQFTPDLMPSDITGTDIIEENRETGRRSYRFLKGQFLLMSFLPTRSTVHLPKHRRLCCRPCRKGK